MTEIFQYNFLIIALAGALLSALSTSQLSVFVSLKKVSFMGEALAHVSFAGIALALLLGLNLSITAIIVVAGVSVLIGFIARENNIDESNITTIFLSVAMALAIILISFKKDYTLDLAGYLFGNVLLITPEDLLTLSILFVANLLFLIFYFKELFYVTYNQEMARVFGLPEKLVYYLFLLFLAVNIVITVKITGIILVTAQLILPGITALNLTRKIKPAILLSIILSLVAGGTGFFISYFLNIPSGATIVLILFLFFLGSLLFKVKK